MVTEQDPTAPNELHLAEIRALAQRYSPEQLETCIEQQLRAGDNPCEPDGPTEEIVNELAKAEFVRHLMAQGHTLPQALRELGRRIRQAQGR